jgi:hypothetical protein
MQILINGSPATLKQGTSFDYISENRLFSGSDDFSLTITFPLRGCPQNQAIFGNICRRDVARNVVRYNCEIRDRGTFCKSGTLTITELTESEVKTQFLEGRSEQNFSDSFDEIYINELDMGEPEQTIPTNITPYEAWNIGGGEEVTAVALPWVNDYSGNLQNAVTYKTGSYNWSSACKALSWQPYLLYLTQRICEEVGYSYDFTAWEQSPQRYLLCCNALPAAWEMSQYARALPHWSITEYLEELELLLAGEFEVDHRNATILFHFTSDILQALPAVELEQVVESYTSELTDADQENSCGYIGTQGISYKECDHEMWKYYSCAWIIESYRRCNLIEEYVTTEELLEATQEYACTERVLFRDSLAKKILHVAETDSYYCLRIVKRVKKRDDDRRHYISYWYCALQPLNLFGESSTEEESSTQELACVPAWIDQTDEELGQCLFLSFSSYDEAEDESSESTEFRQTQPILELEAGEAEERSAYYDVIYVGYWQGEIAEQGKLPYPTLDSVQIGSDWSLHLSEGSLRIDDRCRPGGAYLYSIDGRQKYTMKFLSRVLPEVRALYLIEGQRYLCEKITATFTENGMSQLMKGVFYPVIE